MPRIARIVLENLPFHITQRGNARQKIFTSRADHSLYLDLLQTHSTKAGLELLAYCLMPNHVHLIAIPRQPKAMAQALGRTHANYASYFNLKHRTCGHVWQARFYSCPLDESHLWNAIAYVERNPVRANLTATAADYQWSSTRTRLAANATANLLNLNLWKERYTSAQWRKVLATNIEEEAFGRRLQEASRRGRPFGTPAFTAELERIIGRSIEAKPVGRPRREAAQAH